MRIAFMVYVNLDPVPGGAFDTVDSVLVNLCAILDRRMSHYNVTVSLAPASLTAHKTRPGFIVYTDLDEMYGEMHSHESAQNVIRVILSDISQYRPTVSLAPSEYQPVEEGTN